MKTATITWESYNNGGTKRQAYAIKNTKEERGNKNLTSSYR